MSIARILQCILILECSVLHSCHRYGLSTHFLKRATYIKILVTPRITTLRLKGGNPNIFDSLQQSEFGSCGDDVGTYLRNNFHLNSFQNLDFPSAMYRNMKSKIDTFFFDNPSENSINRRLQGIHVLMYLARHLPNNLQKDLVWVGRAVECATGLFDECTGDIEAEIVCADALYELLRVFESATNPSKAQSSELLIPWKPLFRSILSVHAPGFLPEDQARRLFVGPELAAYHLHSLARLVRAARGFFCPTADEEILDLLQPVAVSHPRAPPS
jgi:hypothetical protein